MGIQIAFAFCLCVLQGFALKTDLTVARDRIIGIVFGDLVIFLVATRLYPVSILPEVEATVRRFLAGIRGLVAREERALLAARNARGQAHGTAQIAAATLAFAMGSATNARAFSR